MLSISQVHLTQDNFHILYFLEAARSGNPEQDVHPDWLLVPGGEKSSGHDLAKVLLSVHQRKQVKKPEDDMEDLLW